ncbi:Uncharacterized protein APZ42_026210 [Daphnia magna]|uniref:MULE transposase domain-containing protein n=1 Tax=Daphnia magna TaxID=35525 RepID=A0A164SEN2_9CRUS|nr:Uncharacterized protein APZ42_026210 [Daphnia magna]
MWFTSSYLNFLIAIAVASFLMTNKTQSLYECCLRRLLEVCQQNTGGVPEPTLLISDYELAILQSLSAVFPTRRARGCYYHSGMVGIAASVLLVWTSNNIDHQSSQVIIITSSSQFVKFSYMYRSHCVALAFEQGWPLLGSSLHLRNLGINKFQLRCYRYHSHCAALKFEQHCPLAQWRLVAPWNSSCYQDLVSSAEELIFFHGQIDEVEYRYLALRDGTPVRDRRRREYITRDREIRTLQIDQQNGRITIREFLIAAAFRFKPVEIEFQEQNAEEFNRPLDEVHAAFEALLHNPHAVINTPDVGVQEDQMVEIEVVLAAENQLEIAAFEDPVANVSTGRGRGRPRGRGDRKFGEHQDGRRMSNWPLSIQQ